MGHWLALIVIWVPALLLSDRHSWGLMLVEHLFLVNQRLKLVVLTLNHLGHGLVEEVLGLVGSWRLVAQGSVSGGHSGVVGKFSWVTVETSPVDHVG